MHFAFIVLLFELLFVGPNFQLRFILSLVSLLVFLVNPDDIFGYSLVILCYGSLSLMFAFLVDHKDVLINVFVFGSVFCSQVKYSFSTLLCLNSLYKKTCSYVYWMSLCHLLLDD